MIVSVRLVDTSKNKDTSTIGMKSIGRIQVIGGLPKKTLLPSGSSQVRFPTED